MATVATVATVAGDFAETPLDLGGLSLSGADVMVLACHPRGFASEASGGAKGCVAAEI